MVTEQKYFVLNNRKRHWNCAEVVVERLKMMEEAIENADDETAKENAKEKIFRTCRISRTNFMNWRVLSSGLQG